MQILNLKERFKSFEEFDTLLMNKKDIIQKDTELQFDYDLKSIDFLSFFNTLALRAHFEPFMFDGVWKLNISNSGERTYISTMIHGYERSGISALLYLLYGIISGKISPKSGEIVISLGNINATRENVRLIDINLNRVILHKGEKRGKLEVPENCYEIIRSDEIRKVIASCDTLYCIHTSTERTDPFIVVEERRKESCKEKDLYHTLWKRPNNESVITNATHTCSESYGIPGYVLENGQDQEIASHINAIMATNRMLVAHKNIDDLNDTQSKYYNLKNYTPTSYELYDNHRLENNSLEFTIPIYGFTPVEKNQPVAKYVDENGVTTKIVKSPIDGVFILPTRPEFCPIGEQCMYFGKKEIRN